jgi:gamma-glutamyl phosphate reductase
MATPSHLGTRSILHFSFYILHLNYMEIINTFKQVKAASKELALITDEKRNDILRAVADAIAENKDVLLEANAKDLARHGQGESALRPSATD